MERDARIALPEGCESFAQAGMAYQPLLQSALDEFYQAATRLDLIDPQVTEMVRLRCARTHDCRICKTLRLRTARDNGVDDAMTEMVDHYETSPLEERIKVALRFTDAYVSTPGPIAPGLVEQLREHFSSDQVVALALQVMKWSTQKMHVALGLDTKPGVDVTSGEVTWFEFDVQGRSSNFVSDSKEPV